jgi:hypothetical protein
MDPDELSDADDELRSRPLLSLCPGARADAADAIVSASRFSSYFVSFQASSSAALLCTSVYT